MRIELFGSLSWIVIHPSPGQHTSLNIDSLLRLNYCLGNPNPRRCRAVEMFGLLTCITWCGCSCSGWAELRPAGLRWRWRSGNSSTPSHCALVLYNKCNKGPIIILLNCPFVPSFVGLSIHLSTHSSISVFVCWLVYVKGCMYVAAT